MDQNALSKKPEDQANGDEIRLDMFPHNEITKTVLRPDWTFKDSFPGLDLFPFNQLALEYACFVYAPQDQAEYPPWKDGWEDIPADKQNEGIPLQKGLNFAAWLKLDGFSSLLTLLQDLVGTGSTFKFYGSFDPAPEKPYPSATLSAELSNGDFRIGCDPLAFTLSRPRLVVKVANTEDGTQDMGLAMHADSSLGLDFSVGISATGDKLTFEAEPVQDKPFTIKKMLDDLPGRIGDFQRFLPDELESIFGALVEGVGLQHLTLIMQTNTREIRYWEISVGTVKQWEVIPGVITLDKLVFQVGALYLPTTSSPLNMVSLFATAEVLKETKIFPGEFDFAIEIEKATEGKWQVSSIRGQYFGNVLLDNIVYTLLNVPIPDELKGISFSDFGVIVHPSEGSYECYGTCLADFPLLDSELRSSLVINVEYSKQGCRVYLDGVLEIGGQSFSLKVDFSGQEGGNGNLRLAASWEALSLDSILQLEDIVRALGLTPPDIPYLSLKSASFAYDFNDQTLVLEVETLNDGKAVFACCKNQATDEWLFFFGVAINEISLPRLPLVAEMLPAGQAVKVEKIKLLVASTALDPTRIGQINGLIGEDYPTIPAQGMPDDFAFSAQLDLGGYLVPLSTGAAGQPERVEQEYTIEEGQTGALAGPPDSQAPSGGETGAPLEPKSAAGEVTWFNVNKSLGPVSFRRVGAKYTDGALWFLLDASLKAAGLQLSVIGLAISPLGKLEPVIDLSGLALSYARPPLEITGALMKVPAANDIKLKLDGMVKVKALSFNLVAIGSYSQKESGDTSLFVFAMLDKALGGPPCFYVTGLAAGFGYNIAVRSPTIEKVKDFPLLAAMVDPTKLGIQKPKPPDPMAVLNTLHDWIIPEPGAFMLAAGVSFRSFDIIQSDVLAIVEFGKEFQVLVVGFSTLKLPKEGDRIYAYAELMIQIIVKPADGVVAAMALLTPNSYLLDKDCHLTGGAAFFLWFGNNPHAGDFVLTLGGYHPDFEVPPHYPQPQQVPRLGFNWPLSRTVTIKGEAYFALTPSNIMTGGRLEILYQTGNLRAWFTAYADVIIGWKPFYFTAQMGVRVGASFRIDMWFLHETVHAELGATLDLWGPPIGGLAHVNWSVISFTVSFGADRLTGPKVVGWNDFKTMLPQRKNVDAAVSPTDVSGETGEDIDPDLAVIQIRVNDGLLQQVDGVNGKKRWIVRADEFAFSIETAVPLTKAALANSEGDFTAPESIGIRPMGIDSVTSEQKVTIQGSDLNEWSYERLDRNMPEAMWSPVAGGGSAEPRLIRCLAGVKNVRPQTGADPQGPGKFMMEGAFSYLPIDLEIGNKDHPEYLPLSSAKQEMANALPETNESPLWEGDNKKKVSDVFEALVDLGAMARKDRIDANLQQIRSLV